eukprot:821694_1
MSSTLKQRFRSFKNATNAKLIRGNKYESSGIVGLSILISKKKMNQSFEICMNQLFNSLLILHTHTFRINKETLSPIVPHSYDQFVVYKDLSLDVRGIVETAIRVSKGKLMWK